MFNYFLYILKCISEKYIRYYTGITRRPIARFREHKNGYNISTKRYNGNIHLVYLEKISGRDKKEALKIALKKEKKIKKWSQKKKINFITLHSSRTSENISTYMAGR